MTRPRDSQRERLYAAERAAELDSTTLGSRDQAQAYIDSITRSNWFQARWGRIHVNVLYVNGQGGRANRWRREIRFGVWSRQRWVALHELAHIVTDRDYAAHGPEFAAAHLKLVEHYLGTDAAKRLRAAYVAGRVKHRASSAIPTPARSRVRTKTAATAAIRAERHRPVMSKDAMEAVAVLRRAIRTGVFGPSGAKPRTHALATARMLERAHSSGG